jgi:class 3 adenylate cyclase
LLGILATTMRRWDDAERHFEDALAMNERMKAHRWVAGTRYYWALMLAERDSPGDHKNALAMVAEALEAAQRMGLKRDLEMCLALKLRLQGVDLSDINTSIDTVAREALAEQPDLKPHAAPDGTVTIMFSDIEGSTAMADRLGDTKFMEVLREHNAIVRKQIKAHNGFEVKSEGDGFMLAFQSARKALDCAMAIQQALHARNSHLSVNSQLSTVNSDEPVHIRIGLHAGEVIKEGEDFFGRNVIMAARVASQAHGGEILASAVVKTLMQGSDVVWGEKRTRDLGGELGVALLSTVSCLLSTIAA